MSEGDRISRDHELGRARVALDAETERCFALQQQLERSAAEFEKFVSTATHNLREYLREVTSFSQLLPEAGCGRPGSEAAQYLEQIQHGTAAMESLLAGMVEYSSAGLLSRQRDFIATESVLRAAELTLDAQIRARNAAVTHGPLPTLSGNFGLLSKVLHHLIRNAVAYCESSSPRVHVSCVRAGPEWIFSVKDNGPGIEAQFHTSIFGVFKRLHGRDSPGNGLGLAFCKTAIEAQGGRIWVESAPGAGSTFFFTVPADFEQ